MQSDATKVIAGALLIFGLIFLYTKEITFFQNTLNLSRLLVSAVLGGLVFGAVLGWFLGKERKERIEQFQLFLGVTVVSVLLMPLLLSRINRQVSTKTTTEEMQLIRMETFAGSRFGNLAELKENPDGFRAFLNRNGTIIRLQKEDPPFPEDKVGKQVSVPVTRGILGFELVNWD